jgi:hypothetical protein
MSAISLSMPAISFDLCDLLLDSGDISSNSHPDHSG